MYAAIASVDLSTVKHLRSLADTCEWKIVKDAKKDFQTCYIEPPDDLPWSDWHAAFFLKIPPGGNVHKHVDQDHTWQTYHVPIQTNHECVSYVEGKPYHLQVGHIYSIDRSKEHYSVNLGKTDRIHLLCEINA